MLELPTKNRSKAVLLLLFLSISGLYTFHIVSMWQKASILSNDASTPLSAFVEASDWLSENLGQDEIALVPMRDVFYALEPQKGNNLVNYELLWDSASVILRANTTETEVQRVRSYFINFLKEDLRIKYVVRDWNDPYAKRLFEVPVSDELMLLLREVKTIPFTLSKGWSNKIIIYERVPYTALLINRLSSPTKQSFVIPSNASVQYSWSGATIQKVGPRVGFYMRLEGGINTSKQNYLTMNIKLDIEDLNLIMVFYCDKNRDGKFSGYDVDYTESVTFDQNEQGWVRNQWYTIFEEFPQLDDPVVQIGIILTGDKDGSIILADLIIYSEITPDLVFIEASMWLSENLKEDEFVLVPASTIFHIAQAGLTEKLTLYRSLWASAGVTLGVDLSNEKVLKVRSYLVDFLKGNVSAKYLVRDWVDPYAEYLFEAIADDELMFLLREVKDFSFTLEGRWSREVRIYERVQYTTLLSVNFSAPPEDSFAIPQNASVQFDSNGATIQKVGPRVGFYMRLEGGINTSKQNYLTMNIKLDIEDLNLIMVFYCDKNRDGKFSGYDVDYTEAVTFDQNEQGWVRNQWYTIFEEFPQLDDPVVQIGIILTGDKDGSITIADLVMFGEATLGI